MEDRPLFQAVFNFLMADKSVSTDSLAMDDGKPAFKGKKFRVAFIGCGGIAQTHLNALKEFPDVEVVAGVDINPARLKVMEEKWGVTQLYKDWKTMLKEVKPDAVDICTPNGVHAQPAIDAANAGCHVIVEKPMAMTPAEAVWSATAGGADDSGIATGWALGAGINLALDDNWSTSLQYLHTDLSGPTLNADEFYATNSHPASDSVSAGINYKF